MKPRIHFILFVVFALALPDSIQGATLLEGMIKNEARIEITSLNATSGDSLLIEVQNASAKDQTWTIPSGLIAQAELASAPQMAIRALKGRRADANRYEPANAIQLKPGARAPYVVEAYSMDMRKATPPVGTRYAISGQRNDLAQLFRLADENGIAGEVLQTAVWLAAMDVPREQLRQSLPLSASDFDRAADLAMMAKGGKNPATSPSDAAPTSPASQPPSLKPILILESGATKLGKEGEKRSATIELKYRWTVPPAQRPRKYIVTVRFESGSLTSAVVPAEMIFDGEEGAYESVVEQGVLEGKGELVYAVLKDMTTTTASDILNRKYDDFAKQAMAELISNIVRVPIDWTAESDSPLDAALAVISTTPLQPGKAERIASPTPLPTPPTPTPRISPTATPAAMDRALPEPVQIQLPLKSGGVLKGTLIGSRKGRLVMRGLAREFEFDPAIIGTPQEIMAMAQSALASGHRELARQYSSIALLLLDDPPPAAPIAEQTK